MPRNSDRSSQEGRDRGARQFSEAEIEAIFGSLLEHAGCGIALLEVVAEEQGGGWRFILLHANPAFCELIGSPAEELLGRSMADALPGTTESPLYEILERLADDGRTVRCDRSIPEWNRHLEITAFAPRDQMVALVLADHSAGKEMELDLRTRRAYFEALFEKSPLAIVLLDEKDRIIDSNHGFEKLFGFSKEETRGQGVDSLIVRQGSSVEASMLSTRVRSGEVLDIERVRQHKDGHLVDVRIIAQPVHLDDKRIAIYGIYSDISHQKRDLLTGLPNRASFSQLLENELIDVSALSSGLTAVLVILIRGLRDVNDAYGLQAGDDLLVAVAERLRTKLEEREGTVPARIGSKTYAVLQIELVDVGSAEGLARRLLAEFARPFWVGERKMHISASIGVALAFPGTSANRLLSQAERAARQAQAESPNSFLFHTSDVDQAVLARMHMGQRLYDALERDELDLDYQLQVDLNGGEHGLYRICGVEALLRWRDADGKPVATPKDFIPVAEATGQIVRIGEWVMHTACVEARQWQHETGLEIPVAVNLSPVQFKDEKLVEKVRRALEDSGLPHHLLELEITERLLMEPTPRVERALQRLAELGVRIALDDFGQGHSSWGYLRRDDLSLSKIKIDKSILQGIESTPRDAAILSVLAALGRKIGIAICAEGVELQRQIDFLLDERCDQAQGFLLGRPVPAAENRRLVRRGLVRLRNGDDESSKIDDDEGRKNGTVGPDAV